MSSHHLIDRSFLITTYHVVSAMITCQFRHFFHLCPLIWSAADRDTVLSLEFVNEKFRCVHLSRHPRSIFASERVSLLFCSFKKKFPKKLLFCTASDFSKRQFLVIVKFYSALQTFPKLRDALKSLSFGAYNFLSYDFFNLFL